MTFRAIRTWSMALCCAAALLSCAVVSAQSIRFFGSGSSVPDRDRVKIRIDDPLTDVPGPPVDVGQTDFTIEFWLRPDTTPGRNGSSAVACGAGQYSWINGNIILDRDRFGQQPGFGVALANGRIVFGVWVSGTQHTICGTSELRNDRWHHVAVQRQRAGLLEILVDGRLEASAPGPAGDISYPDDGRPSPTACGGGSCDNSDPFIVIGAEKHDFGPSSPAYAGWMAELRFSTVRRYSSANYDIPGGPFDSSISNTVALYRFDQVSGASAPDATGQSPSGVLQVGGLTPGTSGPLWSNQSPFTGAGTVSFSAPSFDGMEGGNPVAITVSRIGGSSGEATVEVRVNAGGTANEGEDFSLPASRTLRWLSGESGLRTLSMTIVDDTAAESTETVALELASVTGATIGSQRTATVNIADNDSGPAPPGGTLQFSTNAITAAEGGAAVQLTVRRAGGASGAATVEIAVVGGTATEGSDFTLPATRTLSWGNADSADKTLTLTFPEDTAVEGTETASFELRNVTGAVLGSPVTASVSITDNDTSAGTPPPSSSGGGGGGGGSLNALYLLCLAGVAANRALRLRKRAVPIDVL